MSNEMTNIHKEILIPNRVCIRGLDSVTKEEDLNNIFLKFGTIIETKIIRDICNGESLGLGFITFDSQRVAEHVVSTCSTMEINGKEVFILPAKIQRIRKPKSSPSNCSFNAYIPDPNDTYLSLNRPLTSLHIVPTYPIENEVFYKNGEGYPVKNIHKDRCFNLANLHHPFEVIDNACNPNCVLPVYIPNYGMPFLTLNGNSIHTSTNQVHGHVLNGREDISFNGIHLQNGISFIPQAAPSVSDHSRRNVNNILNGASSPINNTGISRVSCSSPISPALAPPPTFYRLPFVSNKIVEENSTHSKKENVTFTNLVNFSEYSPSKYTSVQDAVSSSKYSNVQDVISCGNQHKEQKVYFIAAAPGKVKRVVVN
ncbi:uncharacterized protein LOC101238376 [Hydra vulgaris]|uniref:uncharacterized protein LOC101238376 n=1 Tax=Hydra vulgaris TaxID=6087 RepID=UPI001F5E8992|nr:uncharacterized protein LOC101238376 [Hydra vulgaris]